MNMKQSIALFLPILLGLASCGTTAQYSQQRFTDGIYSKTMPEDDNITLYSQEDFEQIAANEIARKRDTVYVVLDKRDNDWLNFNFSPFHFGLGYWGYNRYFRYYDPWYYNSWYGGFYNPWYYNLWYGSIYDPWYYPWSYDPWYWNMGYYPSYGPGYLGGGYRPPKPGLSPGGDYYYGPRRDTQSGGSRVNRPGSSNIRLDNVGNSYIGGGSNYGSSGSSIIGSGRKNPSRSIRNSSSSSTNASRYDYNTNSNNNHNNNSSSWNSSSSTNRNNNYNYNSGSSYSSGSSSRSYSGGGGSSSRSGGGGNSRGGGRR